MFILITAGTDIATADVRLLMLSNDYDHNLFIYLICSNTPTKTHNALIMTYCIIYRCNYNIKNNKTLTCHDWFAVHI